MVTKFFFDEIILKSTQHHPLGKMRNGKRFCEWDTRRVDLLLIVGCCNCYCSFSFFFLQLATVFSRVFGSKLNCIQVISMLPPLLPLLREWMKKTCIKGLSCIWLLMSNYNVFIWPSKHNMTSALLYYKL